MVRAALIMSFGLADWFESLTNLIPAKIATSAKGSGAAPLIPTENVCVL